MFHLLVDRSFYLSLGYRWAFCVLDITRFSFHPATVSLFIDVFRIILGAGNRDVVHEDNGILARVMKLRELRTRDDFQMRSQLRMELKRGDTA
jgi:hypothetical protein